MSTSQTKWLCMFCCLILGMGQSCPTTDELNLAEFEKLHALLVPTAETWKTIPWQTNLWTAQGIAVAQKKPIFIWAMDGHPLGCT